MRPEQLLDWGFAGCKAEGHAALTGLIAAGYVPRFVCVLEEIPADEQQEFSAIAESVNVPFFTSRNLLERNEELATLDVLLTCRFNLLPESVFDAPRLGSINIHQSLLPAYRGVHPTAWALVRGESETGVSIHRIDAGIDTGEILAQTVVAIADDDDYATVSENLVRATAELAVEFWRQLERDRRYPPPLKPRNGGDSFYARRRSPADGKIIWEHSTRSIRNLVRALPQPRVHGFCQRACGATVAVTKTRPLPAPGTVLAKTEDGCYVVANGDAVSLIETDAELRIGERLC